jgi:hypothetical protein
MSLLSLAWALTAAPNSSDTSAGIAQAAHALLAVLIILFSFLVTGDGKAIIPSSARWGSP